MISEFYIFLQYIAKVSGISVSILLITYSIKIFISKRKSDMKFNYLQVSLSLLIMMAFSVFLILWLHG
jgi:hypothetical protein